MLCTSTFLKVGARCARTSAVSRRGMGYVVVGDHSAFNKLEAAEDRKKVFYFTATWCPPCRMIAPIFEKMAAEHPDIDFCKVDVDDVPEAAAAYSVSGVPTFSFLQGKDKVNEIVGADEGAIRRGVAALEGL